MTNLSQRKEKIANTVFLERSLLATLAMVLAIVFGQSAVNASHTLFVKNWRTYCINTIMSERMQSNPDYLRGVILKEVKEYCG